MVTASKTAWIVTISLLAVSLLYIALAYKSLNTLTKVRDGLDAVRGGNDDDIDQLKTIVRGGLAACVLSIIAVAVYVIFSSLVTLTQAIDAEAVGGAMYGILLTSTLYSSAFMLLSGIVLQSNGRLVDIYFSGNTENEYNFSYITAFLMVGVYASLFGFYLWRMITLRRSYSPNQSVKPALAMQPTSDQARL